MSLSGDTPRENLTLTEAVLRSLTAAICSARFRAAFRVSPSRNICMVSARAHSKPCV